MTQATLRLWDKHFNLLYTGPADEPINWTLDQTYEDGTSERTDTGVIYGL